MEDAGITPLDIQNPEDLALLPPLTCWYLEHHREDLMARSPGKKPTDPTGRFSSSNRRHRAVEAALEDRRRQSAGLYPWKRYASMGEREDAGSASSRWGAFAGLVKTVVDRRIQFDICADRELAFKSYLQALRKHRPDHLVGTAELVSEFACYCRRNAIDDLRFKAALVEEGELSGEGRGTVESVFKTRVFSRYGCEHIPLIAWQCKQHDGLHLNEDAMILELDPVPGSPAGHGRVLVTDLYNFRMPLIRFEVGDVAKWGEPALCRCGCSLRRLAAVEGSVAEYMSRRVVNLPSGSKFISALGSAREGWGTDLLLGNRWMN